MNSRFQSTGAYRPVWPIADELDHIQVDHPRDLNRLHPVLVRERVILSASTWEKMA